MIEKEKENGEKHQQVILTIPVDRHILCVWLNYASKHDLMKKISNQK